MHHRRDGSRGLRDGGRLRWFAGAAAALALPLTPAAALAQAAPASSATSTRHISLTIDESGGPAEGAQVADALRQRFARAQLFRVVDEDTPAGFHIHLSTIKGDGPAADVVSVAVVLTMTDMAAAAQDRRTPLEDYLASTVGVCGRNVLQQCAETIYAAFGSQIRETSDSLAAMMQAAQTQDVELPQ